MIEHLPRWLFSSITKHISAAVPNYPIFIEGQHRLIERVAQDHIEIRVDGPYLSELSKGYWRISVEINVIIHSVMNDKNFHRKWVTVGAVVKAMDTIPVYDSESKLIGCLRRKESPRGVRGDWISVNHFGQIEPQTHLEQSSVEAHYMMDLEI